MPVSSLLGAHPTTFSLFSSSSSGGTLDQQEFQVFIAMLNLKLNDEEQEALWAELDENGNGSLTFLELQTAVNNKERQAAEEKSARDQVMVVMLTGIADGGDGGDNDGGD